MKKYFLAFIGLFFMDNLFCLPAQKKPQWIEKNQEKLRENLDDFDYRYFVEWLNKNVKNADDFVIDIFKQYPIVLVGEQHNVKEHKDFILKLLPKLYHEAGVRCLVWEFSDHEDNQELADLINSQSFDEGRMLNFARKQAYYSWNSKSHWDFIKGVWELNKALENKEKMRFYGINRRVDWKKYVEVLTKAETRSEEYQKMIKDVDLSSDTVAANNFLNIYPRECKKALIFFGKGHDETGMVSAKHPILIDKHGKPLERPLLGNLLFQKTQGKVFHLFLQGSMSLSAVDMSYQKAQIKGQTAFDLRQSPFAKVANQYIHKSDAKFNEYSTYSQRAHGFVHFGYDYKFQANEVINEFITDEHFSKHKEIFNSGKEQPFKNAKEYDLYLQKNRWPLPK